jgi:hypothetical protein
VPCHDPALAQLQQELGKTDPAIPLPPDGTNAVSESETLSFQCLLRLIDQKSGASVN